MTFWVSLWKFVFLTGASLFALVTIWVAVAGIGDIRKMFAVLGREGPAPKRGKGRKGTRRR